VQPNKRYSLFAETAAALGADIVELEVRPSSSFSDKTLFYQYLIGILRMNRLIAPLQ
ncbi:methylthioribose kinase, partial [bacterium LRH843]|nr:methylthioribose kinase [bacterium LRH843]